MFYENDKTHSMLLCIHENIFNIPRFARETGHVLRGSPPPSVGYECSTSLKFHLNFDILLIIICL